ncbi:MAG TPA: DUF1499 domain-containing protein [Thermoanaerobaculia bacterium]|nr:DUF1499 domain-containing protein [Thermoanaerobaculia bacterium]
MLWKIAALLALSAVVSLALSGPGTRWGWWDFRLGLRLFAFAALLGLVAALLGALAGHRAPRGSAAARASSMAVLVGVTALLLPAWAIVGARRVPAIHDITTDLDEPPRFRAALAARGGRANPVPEAIDPAVAAQHRAAYSDLQPLVVPDPPEQAFGRALDVARGMGWQIVAVDEREGIIEATATTPWFGFRDDVAIRVRPDRGGSRIDLRSTSRVGRSDAGANAARIRRFLLVMQRPA